MTDVKFIKITGDKAVFHIGDSIQALSITNDAMAVIKWNTSQPANDL